MIHYYSLKLIYYMMIEVEKLPINVGSITSDLQVRQNVCISEIY